MTSHSGRPEKFGCSAKHCEDLSYYMVGFVSIGRYCEKAGRPIRRMHTCPAVES